MRARNYIAGLVAAIVLIPAAPAAITAHAGTLTATYQSTLGGPGHAGMYPSGMEIAPNGNLVIADTGNDQIAEYDVSGNQLWRIGSEGNGPTGRNTATQFQQPRDVGVDSSGNVYVADNGNGRVVKLDPTGNYLTKWKANPTTGSAPIGITVSTTPAGQQVYVSDGNKSQINVFDTSGTFISTISSVPGCTLNRMRDAAADAAGNVFVANYEANTILEFVPNGASWTCGAHWGTKGTQSNNNLPCNGNGSGAFANPYGVAVGNDPNVAGGEAIYVADSNDDCIQEFTVTGPGRTVTFIAQMGMPGNTAGTFTQLRRVAVDSAGNVWGADLWGNRVERFHVSTSGPETYTYDETIPNPVVPPGTTDTQVFNQVRGIGFDSSGNVLAMDTVNQRVVAMNPTTGHIMYMCGQRGFTSVGDFNWPRGVAVDQATNHLWVADTKQSDIQVLNNASSCDAVAQFGVVGSALGNLNYPFSIAIRQGDHTAWIADNNNNRVESWNVSNPSVSGAISTYGTLGGGNGQLSSPSGVGIDGLNGNVLVADTANNRIVELSDTNGASISQLTTFTDAGSGTSFNQPYGVAADSLGDIAVADRGNNRVVVLNPDGTQGTVITGSDVTGGGPTKLFNPENVAFGPDGKLYIADTYNDRILVYSLSAGSGGPHYFVSPTYSQTLVSPGQASMYPVDASNNSGRASDGQYYFLLDPGRYRVLAMNRTNQNIDCSIGGMQGSVAGKFGIGDARALWFDPANGELFVADTPNNRIEVLSFSPSACAANSTNAFQFLYQFGTTGTGNGQFNNAYGVAVDATNGFVYATSGSGWVEKWILNGNSAVYSTKFGQTTLNQPRQVSVAANSDVFVMDARNHQVVVFDSNGNDLLHFGSLGAGNGQFTDDPRGLDISADGTLAFVTDSGGKRIEVFNLVMGTNGHYSAATFNTTILPGTTGNQQLIGPRGLTVTADNHVLLTDEWGFNVHEFSFVPSTTPIVASQVFDSTPTAPPVPGVNAPRGIRVAPDGQLYMVDYWNQRIEYMNTDGTNPVAFGFRGKRTQPGALNFAWDAAIQPSTGDVYVANRESNQIEVFTGTGTYLTTWGKFGTLNGQFNLPQGIAFAPDGSLYVADTANGRIQKFTVGAGTVGTWAATYGAKGSSAPGLLNQPTGITFTADGTLWVADTINKAVQKMSPGGVWTKYTSPQSSVQQPPYNVPWGITAAPDGSIWVSVTGNNAIVAIDPNDNLIFSATGATIGVPAINGTQTIFPYTVAFDTSNNVYLTDIWNNRVLVLTTHLAP